MKSRINTINSKMDSRFEEVFEHFKKLEAARDKRHEFQEVKRLEVKIRAVEQKVI